MFLNEWLVWSSSHHSSPAQSTLTGRLCMFVSGPRHNRVPFLETFPAGRHHRRPHRKLEYSFQQLQIQRLALILSTGFCWNIIYSVRKTSHSLPAWLSLFTKLEIQYKVKWSENISFSLRSASRCSYQWFCIVITICSLPSPQLGISSNYRQDILAIVLEEMKCEKKDYF